MTYLELAIKVLKETQKLLWVDDIWATAKEKGYYQNLDLIYDEEEDNIKALDHALYVNVNQNNSLGLLKEKGLYYLTSFEQLPMLIEEALDGPSIRTFQEIVDKNQPKKFSPSKRGYDGMVLFFVAPVGFPISLYITSSIQGSFYPTFWFVSTTALLTILSAPLVLLYLQMTNCDVTIHPDRIDFTRMFPPYSPIISIPINTITAFHAHGLGSEEQISSDFKYLEITYKKDNKLTTKRLRCHGYINPHPIYNPHDIRIRNHESFVMLRAFLKEISSTHQLDYRES